MNVALVHDSNTFGGMEVHMLLLASHLDCRRYQPYMFVPGDRDPYRTSPPEYVAQVQAMGLTRLSPPDPGGQSPRHTFKDIANTARLLRRTHIDVVHIHTNLPEGMRKVTLAARLGGVKAVLRSEHLPPS